MLKKITFWCLLLAPWILIYLGSASNILVEGVNHAQMPVLAPGGQCTPEMIVWINKMGHDITHVCMSSSSHLKVLADWINLLGENTGMASPGDLLVWGGNNIIGYWWLIWVALLVMNANQDRRSDQAA